ncbi:hypothetical protein AP1H75_11080 [Apilactobacillus apinorum]
MILGIKSLPKKLKKTHRSPNIKCFLSNYTNVFSAGGNVEVAFDFIHFLVADFDSLNNIAIIT